MNGVFAVQTGNGVGDPNNTITIEPAGALNVFSLTAVLDKKIASNGGRIWAESGVQNTIGTATPQPITLNATTRFDANPTALLTVNSVIGGTAGLDKIGNGTVVLTNASNSYTGGSSFSAGILSVSTDSNLGARPAT